MKITLLLFTLALLGLIAALALPHLRPARKPSHRSVRRAGVRPFTPLERVALPCVLALRVFIGRMFAPPGNRLALANAVLTMPGPCDTKLADEAIGRFLLVKTGSDADHIALCDATDVPVGFTRDAEAASGERVAYELLGLSTRATKGTASGAITAGDLLVPGTNGVVRSIVGLSGTTVYICGKALTTAATTEEVVFVPYAPVQRVIA